MDPTTPTTRSAARPVLARLCDRFYGLMAETPWFAELRALHPKTCRAPGTSSSCSSPAGWAGRTFRAAVRPPAPARPPCRSRSAPARRDQWVACMLLAMEEAGIAEPMRERLLQSFFKTADFMRNQPGRLNPDRSPVLARRRSPPRTLSGPELTTPTHPLRRRPGLLAALAVVVFWSGFNLVSRFGATTSFSPSTSPRCATASPA